MWGGFFFFNLFFFLRGQRISVPKGKSFGIRLGCSLEGLRSSPIAKASGVYPEVLTWT